MENLKNIVFLVNGHGTITLGRERSVRCAATAFDTDQNLARLVRREGESLMELLRRLDAAIEDANERHIFADEVSR